MKRPGFFSRFSDDEAFAFPEGSFSERLLAFRGHQPPESPAVDIKGRAVPNG